MKEYAEKSMEELRIEDYAANRKGPQQQAGGMFGGSTVQQPSTGMFGQSQPAGSLFGQQPAQQTTGLFGSNTMGSSPGFGAQNTSTFGAQNTGGLFGKPLSTPAATTASTFGNFGTTQSTAFGFNKPIGQAAPSLFGQPSQPAAGGFGQQAPQNTFGTTSTFGQPAQPSLFGGATSSAAPAPAFGTLGATSTAGNTGFNFGTTAPQQSAGGLFGAPKPTFGTTTGFGAAPATSTAFTGFGTSNPTTGKLYF
jgi:nuclear pore complex protein Nup98-Nup96